ncbi:MAG: PIG-L family deacetylase [Gemmatimonadetes bacterium]|nr:PIG-L family deacetylase [Gemmatimonadota bacterium]
MIDLSKVQRVLSVFAHPDDETLAAGGTLAKLSRLEADIHVLIPATGVHARKNKQNEDMRKDKLDLLRNDCSTAMKCLGVNPENVVFGEFSDNEMDDVTLLSVIHWMEPFFDNIKPDLVLTHHRECTNIDHQICHEAVTVLTRPRVGTNIPVLCGEVPSSTGYRRPTAFEPNVFVEIEEDDVSKKISSMQSYSGEARPDPHPRSPEVLRAIAKVRGSESGFLWAEAFMLLRGFA